MATLKAIDKMTLLNTFEPKDKLKSFETMATIQTKQWL